MEHDGKGSPPQEASTLKIRVLYADTDRMGVAYHGTYFRWFEVGRAHYMSQRGARYASIERGGVFLRVVEAHADCVKPATYDELLDVTAWIQEIGRAQLRFSYRIARDGEELARVYTRHAAVNEKGRPMRLPQEIQRALRGPETENADDT